MSAGRKDGGTSRRSPELGERRRSTSTYCSGSAGQIHDEGSRRDGCCTWCGYRFTGVAPRPRFGRPVDVTELELAYRRFYDPDFGNDPLDL